jgi:DNA-binding transcriptional MocR family regulator
MEEMKDNMLSNGYSLADKVFKKLEEEILNGALKAGENLTELRISARLGVSRTPVREAIHRLEQEGDPGGAGPTRERWWSASAKRTCGTSTTSA